MMRNLSKDQRKLYQQYSRLSEEMTSISELNQNMKYSHEYVWRLISSQGIWVLPMPKCYGGYGLGWQDCIAAFDGFFSNYPDINFLTLFISQVSALYVILQYGTEDIKQRYLPRLMQGEIAYLHISKYIHNLLHHEYQQKINKNQSLHVTNNKIFIYVDKLDEDVIFYICEKKTVLESKAVNEPINSTLLEENKFTAKETGIFALFDLINFERIFYGIFLSSYACKIKNRIIFS